MKSSSKFFFSKFKEAFQDYTKLYEIFPNDTSLKEKVDQTKIN